MEMRFNGLAASLHLDSPGFLQLC